MAGKKRASNKAKKELHAKSYKNAQERKELNKINQAERKTINDEYRARGERTPYQERKRQAYLERLAKKYGKSDA